MRNYCRWSASRTNLKIVIRKHGRECQDVQPKKVKYVQWHPYIDLQPHFRSPYHEYQDCSGYVPSKMLLYPASHSPCPKAFDETWAKKKHAATKHRSKTRRCHSKRKPRKTLLLEVEMTNITMDWLCKRKLPCDLQLPRWKCIVQMYTSIKMVQNISSISSVLQ